MAEESLNIIEIEAVSVSDASVEHRRLWSVPILSTATQLVLFITIVFLPLCFGGVHDNIFNPYGALVLLTAAGLSFRYRKWISEQMLEPSSAPVTSTTSLLFACFLIFAAVQYCILKASSIPHPVFGSVSALEDESAFWSAFLRIALFTAVFMLTRVWLASSRRAWGRLHRTIVWTGVLLAIIGIVHWFSDNGLLFWTFAPDYVTVSPRARWPFVNPNHLGDILLLSVFPALALMINALDTFRATLIRELSRKGSRIGDVLGHRRVQEELVQTALAGLSVVIILVAVMATLSRGAWTGLFAGSLLVYMTLVAPVQADEKIDEQTPNKRRRHRTPVEKLTKRAASLRRYIVPLILCGALLFLLKGRGMELVQGRIEYGLLYSKTDMRWQLYSDTMQMIKDHLIIGVGAGNWEANYFKYMSPLLAGIGPQYLHSDPLQVIAEFGIFGALAVIAVCLYLCVKCTAAAVHGLDRPGRLRLFGVWAGLFAFAAASFVEFPMRIPAISMLVAVELALLCSELDRVAKNNSQINK